MSDRAPVEDLSRRATPRVGYFEFALGLLGVALVGAGATAVFTTDNEGGAAALLGAGAALLVIVVLGDRLETLKWGQVELTLRREADKAARSGDFEQAERLEAAADNVAQQASSIALTYETLRRSMPAGPARTGAMEDQIARARADAEQGGIQADEVLRLLAEGSDGERIWALGVLQAKPNLATTSAVVDVISRPRSPFEQYHALVLAEQVLDVVRPQEQEALLAAISQQIHIGAFGQDTDRWFMANRVLQRIRGARGSG